MPRPAKYHACEEELRQRIHRGMYPTDQVLPSEHQLSEEFGLSRSTIRKALLRLKEQNVIRSEGGKGYFISHGARLTRSDPKQIGFLAYVNFDNWNLTHDNIQIYSRLEEKLLPQGKQLLHIAPESIADVADFCRRLEAFEGQSLLISHGCCATPADSIFFQEILTHQDKRLVLFAPDRPVDFPVVDLVYNDWSPAIGTAVKSLKDRGLQHIVYCGYDKAPWSDRRKAAFLMAMRSEELWDFDQTEPSVPYPHPLEFNKVGAPSNYEKRAAKGLLTYLKKHPHTEAVLCGNDRLIEQIHEQAKGRTLPLLVGFDNSLYAKEHQIPSLGQDMTAMVDAFLRFLAQPRSTEVRSLAVPALFFDR